MFCAASEKIDDSYVCAAREFGKWLGSCGMTLVYGGASKGLMEVVASSAKSTGAHIIGVVPALLEERGGVSLLLDETVSVPDLSERKKTMLERSDIFVALPGGIGTFDEIFHVFATSTMGEHSKKVVFYNVGGFWNTMFDVLCELECKGFLRSEQERLFLVANSLDELKNIITKEDI